MQIKFILELEVEFERGDTKILSPNVMEVQSYSFNASEATRDFMARLRIGIMADQAPPPSAKDGLPTDIAFSQDVIARHARVEWYYEDAAPIEFDKWIPPRWSRRKPAATDDLKPILWY